MLLFEEATLSYGEDGTLLLAAPWMHTRVTDWPGRPQELELYRHPSLHRLPFWYHPARPQHLLPLPWAALPGDPAALESLFVQAERLIAQPFSWNLETLIHKSLCPDSEGVFDPLAAYAVLQRWILCGGLALNELGRLVRKAWGDRDITPSYRELLLELVHFSQVVTRSCPAVLQAARSYPGRAGALMRGFIDGESGHEVFAINSLRLLTENQSSCALYAPRPELRLLLEILQQCAASSPLGLAACLFCFEGLSYDTPTWTPWSSLEAMDRRHASIGVGKHARINTAEHHGEVGLELALALAAPSFEELCLAARLTELCVQTRLQLFRNVLRGRLDFETCTPHESVASTLSRD